MYPALANPYTRRGGKIDQIQNKEKMKDQLVLQNTQVASQNVGSKVKSPVAQSFSPSMRNRPGMSNSKIASTLTASFSSKESGAQF